MNDWYNDPPDEEYDDQDEENPNEDFSVAVSFEDEDLVEFVRPLKCPHGNTPHDCDACDRQSDEAFDADRENRFFGR